MPASSWQEFDQTGHPLEIGHAFQEQVLPSLLKKFNDTYNAQFMNQDLTNSMQFYPEASLPESMIHPDIYRRHKGRLDLSTIQGPGFGYRVDEINRELPPAGMI